MRAMLRVFGISRSGYYEYCSRPASRHSPRDQALKAKIKDGYKKSRGIYGARQILSDLKDQCKGTCRARINCLMKEEDIHSNVHRKFKATTNSNHSEPVLDNVPNRQFKLKPEAPDQVCADDITCVPTQQG